MVKSSLTAALSIIMVATFCIAQEIKCPIQSIYQFGDSLSDAGNTINMPISAAARPPYGITFPGYPTGRFSDGLLIIDYIAMALGLPLLNAYLNKTASFNNGVNFAAGGATALNSSFYLERGITVLVVPSLSDQLTSFNAHLNSICTTPTDCADKLSKSLVFVGEIGYNDIAVSLTLARPPRPHEEIFAYIPLVVEAIINTTKEVIKNGASQVIVPGAIPIGCSPLALSILSSNDSIQYDDVGCLRSANDLTTFLNNQLQEALVSLRKKFPTAVILYADYYKAFQSLLRKASHFGFNTKTLLKPCCGDTSTICGSPGATVCPNPNNYIHWDYGHLTQEAYRHFTQIVLKDLKINCAPKIAVANTIRTDVD